MLYFGNLSKKMFHKKHLKITKSGHTDTYQQ